MKIFRLRWFSVLLIILLLYFQYHLWFAEGSIQKMRQLQSKWVALKAENDMLKERNQALWFQINRMKNSKEITEEKARHDLGMIKKDETFYQFVK